MSTDDPDDREVIAKKNRGQVERGAFVAAGTAAAAAAVGVTAAVAKVQTRPFDRRLWNAALLQEGAQRDRPINEIPIVVAHNSGTQAGSGTMFFSQNQTMTPYDLLNDTPARGLEFQVESVDGTLVTNHGAQMSHLLVDKTVQSPQTLDGQLSSVRQWLDKPANSDQVIVIKLTNNDPDSRDAINKMLREKFGDELFTASDFRHAAASGGWPSVNELTANGKHVIVLSTWCGDSPFGYTSEAPSIPSSWVVDSFLGEPSGEYPASMDWRFVSEDRTMLGGLGSGVTASLPKDMQFTGSIDTAQMDKLCEEGGLIGLDKLQPNDPRIVAPEHRDQLALDPDVSLFNGMIQINRGLASSALFGLGIFSTAGTATFSIAEMGIAIYQNMRYVQAAQKHLEQTIASASSVAFETFFNKKQAASHEPLIEEKAEQFAAYCQKQMLQQLTYSTLRACATSVTSIAASIFFIGQLFPLIFPVTTILSIAFVVVGTIASGIAIYCSRAALRTRLQSLFQSPAVQEKINQKLQAFTAEDSPSSDVHQSKANEQEIDTKLSKVSGAFFGSMLFLRIGSMAKYAVAAVGVIAPAIILVAVYIKGLVDAVINYRNRQKHFENIPKLIAEATLPVIDKKRFIFFGETVLEKYVRQNRATLLSDHADTDSIKDPRKLLKHLATGSDPSLLQDIRKKCTMSTMEEKLKRFCKDKKETYDPRNDALLEAYCAHRVKQYITRDVKASGRINAFKLASIFAGSGSFLAPPFVAFFMAAGVGMMLVSEIVTRLVARREKKRFAAATNEAFQCLTDTSHRHETGASASQTAATKKALTNFLTSMREGLLSSAAPTVMTDSTTPSVASAEIASVASSHERVASESVTPVAEEANTAAMTSFLDPDAAAAATERGVVTSSPTIGPPPPAFYGSPIAPPSRPFSTPVEDIPHQIPGKHDS